MMTIAGAIIVAMVLGLLLGPFLWQGSAILARESEHDDLEDRQSDAFRELRDLELDFSMQKVDADEYERSRIQLEDEVIRGMKVLDESPAGSDEDIEAVIAERRARWRKAAGSSLVGIALWFAPVQATAVPATQGVNMPAAAAQADTSVDLLVHAVNGTEGASVPAGLAVTLEGARGGGMDESLRREGTLDEGGAIRFRGLPNASGVAYRISTIYQEAEYATDWLVPQPGSATAELAFTVWEATEDPAAIRTKYEHMVIQPQPGGLTVQQMVVLENTGDRAYIGPMYEEVQQRGVLKVLLADGAKAISLDSGLMECCVRLMGTTLIERMPLFPGTRQVAFSYSVEAVDERVDLPLQPAYPLERAEVFVPADLEVSLRGGLRVEEGITAGDAGQSYQRLAADALPAGTRAGFSVAGIAPAAGLGLPKGVILGGALLSLLAGLVVVSRKRAGQEGRHGQTAEREPGGTDRVPVPDLETDRDLIIERIAWLDELKEAGAIEEDFYRREREALVTLAKRVDER